MYRKLFFFLICWIRFYIFFRGGGNIRPFLKKKKLLTYLQIMLAGCQNSTPYLFYFSGTQLKTSISIDIDIDLCLALVGLV